VNINTLLQSLTPTVYDNLKRAIELGKWPDGTRLTSEQRQMCMQAVIAYEQQHLPPEKHTGHIPYEAHDHCASDEDNHSDHQDEKPIKWIE
jgi:uncharacterized protein